MLPGRSSSEDASALSASAGRAGSRLSEPPTRGSTIETSGADGVSPLGTTISFPSGVAPPGRIRSPGHGSASLPTEQRE